MKSKCCNAPVSVCSGSPDFGQRDGIRTCWYSCVMCGKPCDLEPEDAAPDAVSPSHYQYAGIEAREYMRWWLDHLDPSVSRYSAHCAATAMYYLMRAGLKGDPAEDHKKAAAWWNFKDE